MSEPVRSAWLATARIVLYAEVHWFFLIRAVLESGIALVEAAALLVVTDQSPVVPSSPTKATPISPPRVRAWLS